MSTSMTNPPSPGDEEMGGFGPPQRPQLESEQAEVHKAYGSILKLSLVLAFGMITVVAQETSRFHCVHWWIPFSLILIVSFQSNHTP